MTNARPGLMGHNDGAKSPFGPEHRDKPPSYTSFSPGSERGTGLSTPNEPPVVLSAWTLTAVPHTFGYDCTVEALSIPQHLNQQHVREH